MVLVIGLAGRIGSGKGTVSEYLIEKKGAQQFVYSAILTDILKRLNQPVTRENLQKLGAGLRNELGDEVLVDAMKGDLEGATAEIRLIDGLRYVNEVDMLKKFPNNVLVFVDVPLEMRHERIKKRAEKGEAEITLDKFKELDKAPTEKELDQIKAMADHIIDNSGTVEELFKQADGILDG